MSSGYWPCTSCGAMGSEEDHTTDNDEGECPTCQEPVRQFEPGMRVVYKSFPMAKPEFGTVIGVSLLGLVFVQYDGDRFGKATPKDRLEIIYDQI